jgi:hypothetical protein
VIAAAVAVADNGFAATLNPFGRFSSRPKCVGIRFFRNVRNGANANRRYLLIHGDESTARLVLDEHMQPGGGGRGVAYLIDNPARNIPFRGGRLDPNRMFSDEGAERNLNLLNPGWHTSQVLNGVTYLGSKRHELVNRLIPPAGGLILALHNNQRGYNVRTEAPISDAVALQDPEHPEDFALVTDPADFASLRNGKFNVVLQARPKGAEDGSLSRLAVRLGVRYVNLEAGLGNTEKQRSMLRWVEESLA